MVSCCFDSQFIKDDWCDEYLTICLVKKHKNLIETKKRRSQLKLVNQIELKLRKYKKLEFHKFFHRNQMLLRDWPADLCSLTDLSLSGCGLNQLEPTIFQNLIHLKSLDLSKNSIQNLDSTIFIGPQKLTHLYVNANQISVIPEGLFQNLEELKHLDLKENRINFSDEKGDYQSPNVFQGLNQLNVLLLRYNQISHIPVGTFQSLDSLEILHMGYNKLTFLNPNCFQGLNQLFALNLNNNELSHIPEGIFQGLVSLQFLYMSSNKIDFIDQNGNPQSPNVFQGLAKLKRLSLCNNQISSIQSAQIKTLFQNNDKFKLYLDDERNRVIEEDELIFQLVPDLGSLRL